MWINAETKEVFKLHSDIRSAFSNVSFPSELTDEIIADIGLLPVMRAPEPEYDETKNISEGEVVLKNGEWVQTWVVTDATPEEIEERRRAKVPQVLTRAQARGALILAGLIDQVQPALDAIEDPLQRALAQNDWDNRLEFERTHPQLLAIAEALGLTDERVDQLFITGATL